MLLKHLQLILLFCIAVTSCETRKRSNEIAEQGITSYPEAVSYVKRTYNSDSIVVNNGDIYKLEFFNKGEFLLIYFMSKKHKGYIYQNYSSEDWQDFSTSNNKTIYYNKNIKGNDQFYLKL